MRRTDMNVLRFKTLDENRQIIQIFMYKYINTYQIGLALSVIK